MSLVGFKAGNHPQQVGKVGAKDHIDDRATTPEMFAPLNERFGFTLDVAASAENAKCARYFTKEDDGLTQRWADERVWCNPPYSDIGPWVQKAWAEWTRSASAELVVMLLPNNRCEQGWWQTAVEPYRDRGQGLSIEFLPGRPRFLAKGQDAIKPNERPPFGVCLAIWAKP